MKEQVKFNKKLLPKLLRIPQNKLDKRLIDMILKKILNFVEKQNLYNESSWIVSEYTHLQNSLNALYSFMYTPQQSNLSFEDAQVFASYAVQQSKKIKDIVNILADNKMKKSI